MTGKENVFSSTYDFGLSTYDLDFPLAENFYLATLILSMPTKTKKICIISGIFHPESGGPATYLYNLSNDLHKSGNSIQVIAYGDQKEWLKINENYPYKVLRISRQLPVLLRLILFIKTIINNCRDFDVLYVNDYGLPAVLANIFLKKPIVMKIVGDFAWEFSIRHNFTKRDIDSFQLQRGLKIGFMKILQKFYVSKAARIITPSQYLKSIITGWQIPSNKVTVVYNAINCKNYQQVKLNKKLTNKVKTKGTKVILTVARLVPWKGIDKTIKAIAGLKNKANIRYIVAGEGNDLNRLKKLTAKYKLKKQVLFLGKVEHEDIKQYLKLADIFILYSGYEGLPHVILEAMSAGLPVIVSSSGGTKEVIRSNQNGFVVDIDDQVEFQAKIALLLNNKKTYQTMAKNNLKAIKKYDWPELLKKTKNILFKYSL
jgi:glycosyltransferase involved in cell wall biosynthesis